MKEEINQSLKTLASGGTLIYPTDTIWGLGCDATNQAAVKKIYKIKNRSESKSLIILVDGIAMLQDYVDSIAGYAVLRCCGSAYKHLAFDQSGPDARQIEGHSRR